ncbi:hypothetical protein BFX16_18110, partial [Vibrio cholerae]
THLLEMHFTQKHHTNTRPEPKAVSELPKLTAFKVELTTYKIHIKESAISARMKSFVKPCCKC